MSDDHPPDDDELAGDDRFQDVFGEELSAALDLGKWDTGFDFEHVMARFEREIASAIDKEGRVRALIRGEILPLLGTRIGTPAEAGVYRTNRDEMRAVQEGKLFAGRVEAVSGTTVSHDSLPIGITQFGVAVVSYGGTSGTFAQRFFRKEMSSRNTDAVAEAMALIEMRQNRHGVGRGDGPSRLAYRCIRSYAERAVLVDKAESEWRIGMGHPCPHEMLSGSGYMGLLRASLDVLQRLIQRHKKFVFVPDTLEGRGYLTLGYALAPGEYAILKTLESDSVRLIQGWQYGDEGREAALDFVRRCCPDVLIGLYRISERTPPRLFYAHREHVHLAARVAMADSVLRPERSFPMLLDVADVSCRNAFGADGFLGLVHDAYAHAGANLQFFQQGKKRG
ncbi:hypothetical protein [Vitiosangium sp. GDMCC 1.1324]|uniref:hypothetical protein n=1 Tax=Vitiosangium sp. (strain GDMCC 1.1324) TaxID=2138576 RepID=UPI000D389F36|nr:hypothetical protein [Vitiosangium sp. GDMCC 1.1324]PTL82212.1 hypothetical protein DAT35_20705 [Vitiosangium sp. GDMCC 1.1324]